MRRIVHIGSFACLLWAACSARAQAVPTAERSRAVQIGASWSIANPDYAPHLIQGISIYGTYDLVRNWGIEGAVHRVSAITPAQVGEDSYLLGPRYVFRYGHYTPYGKALFGLGRFKYTIPQTSYTYKIYAFGGGVDVHASEHIKIRAIDFEYQQWPSFQPNGLAPLMVSFGAAYAFR